MHRVISRSRRLPEAVMARFLDTEAAGGVVLVAAAVVALAWANSPWSGSYESVWMDETVHLVVNDGLMALFFLVVALEIKRELVIGELSDPRVAALPALAAAGGMVVPALLYLAVNAGKEGAAGWGIPMATDIAFAVGVLALLGSRIPPGLKLFVLTLAVVDDMGAIVVIAVVYSNGIDLLPLGLAATAIAAGIGLRRAQVTWLPAYAVLAIGCWVALHESGVHATLAGVAFGFLAPARDAERIQRRLQPLVGFAIVPIFALANAGVEVGGDALSTAGSQAVAAGVGLGLLLGKVVGITGASILAVRTGLARLPAGVRWPHLVGAATLAAIGFTVSLFVTDLAFDDPALEDAARLAILAVSAAAAGLGAVILRRASAPTAADTVDPATAADTVGTVASAARHCSAAAGRSSAGRCGLTETAAG
jgi:NhaA family Na+:H+ antiporter